MLIVFNFLGFITFRCSIAAEHDLLYPHYVQRRPIVFLVFGIYYEIKIWFPMEFNLFFFSLVLKLKIS